MLWSPLLWWSAPEVGGDPSQIWLRGWDCWHQIHSKKVWEVYDSQNEGFCRHLLGISPGDPDGATALKFRGDEGVGLRWGGCGCGVWTPSWYQGGSRQPFLSACSGVGQKGPWKLLASIKLGVRLLQWVFPSIACDGLLLNVFVRNSNLTACLVFLLLLLNLAGLSEGQKEWPGSLLRLWGYCSNSERPTSRLLVIWHEWAPIYLSHY